MTDVVLIAGPTATGKSALATRLAERFGGEIVSADSMQVYRGMDIGTAKPTAEERRKIPHHMIDVADPGERYSVADYVKGAKSAISEIAGRGRLPVVAGGTGLYIRTLLENIDLGEIESLPGYRNELAARAKADGGQALLEELRAIDPETAARLHANDIKRIIRALETAAATGKPLSWWIARSRRNPPEYRVCGILLTCGDREALYRRINLRVDDMMEKGLYAEAISLADRYGPTSVQAIGYKEFFSGGELRPEAAAELIKQNTRRYAKRQLTWFARDGGMTVFDADRLSPDEIFCRAAEMVAAFLRETAG